MKRTAISYDPFNRRHTREGHPENFRRLEETWNLLQIDGILHQITLIPSTPAPRQAVLRVHTPAYLERLESTAFFSGGHLDADTYLTHDSFDAALLATGGLLNVVDKVLHRQMDNGFALVRPPGHHALGHTGMGFCLLDNVAVAARWAQDVHGLHRILIVDFDVHHGNGTEAMFYDDPSVLFVSTHQYPLYPGTGALEDIGAGAGQGYTANIPIPGGHGDASYAAIFEQVVWPLADRFQPQLILASAGFDAHWADPLAGIRLSLNGYALLCSELLRMADQYCGGKIVFVMEGGYNLEALSGGVCNLARLLLGDAPEDSLGPAASARPPSEIQPLIADLRRLHRLDVG